MVHSHYAAMGGFAIDESETPPGLIPNGRKRLALNGEGFSILAKLNPGAIPNISESELRDKSKENGLAKVLVLIQASWFCVQCIFRLAQGLSIGLLELNTFAHATCTLLIYFLWWDKPSDVEEPTFVRGEENFATMAFLILTQSRVRMTAAFMRSNPPKYLDECTLSPEYSIYPMNTPYVSDEEKYNDQLEFPLNPGHHRVYRLEYFHSCKIMAHHPHLLQFVDFSPTDVYRFELAERAWQDHKHSGLDLSRVFHTTLAPRVRNWFNMDVKDLIRSEEKDVLLFIAGFTIAGFVYGGLHLTAWNAFFPNKTQRLLWQLSALTLVVSGPAFVLLRLIYELYRRLNDKRTVISMTHVGGACPSTPYHSNTPSLPLAEPQLSRIQYHTLEECSHSRHKLCIISRRAYQLFLWGIWNLFIVPLFSYMILYLFARVFLVVECFITLPNLPASAYQVPNWSQYFPHII